MLKVSESKLKIFCYYKTNKDHRPINSVTRSKKVKCLLCKFCCELLERAKGFLY